MPRFLPLLGLLSLTTSCALLDKTAPVSIASDPPGARILIDHRDSGFVTPALLSLELDSTARIDLEYPGYLRATRILVPERRAETVLWRDMYTRSETWHFPPWLSARDGFAPVKTEKLFSPGRVYVRLERSADG